MFKVRPQLTYISAQKRSTMPNYANGKIYAIRSRSRPDLVNIGSTTQPLSKRYAQHMKDFRDPNKNTSSQEVIGIGDSYIELIELWPCTTHEELLKREGEHQRSTPCVNVRIAGRTQADWVNENKEYRAAYRRQHHQDNRERDLARGAAYDLANKEKIAAHKSEKCECECGATHARSNKVGHYRSKKHQSAMAVLEFIYS